MARTRSKEISDATVYIEHRLEQPLRIPVIAKVAGLSAFHFQRLFFEHHGESVSEYVRRRRLEKGARMLLDDRNRSVLDVALETGFETHSAFSRAFKSHFGQSPTAFRNGAGTARQGSNLSGRPFLVPMRSKPLNDSPDVLDLPALWLLYREQAGVVNGSYFPEAKQLEHEFAELAAQAGEGFWASCGAYRGGPTAFSDDSAIGRYGGLFIHEPCSVWSDLYEPLAAGTWAVFPHYGDYEYLYLTWNKLIYNWLPASGFNLRDSWAFEVYLAPPRSITPDLASAQIYLPVQ